MRDDELRRHLRELARKGGTPEFEDADTLRLLLTDRELNTVFRADVERFYRATTPRQLAERGHAEDMAATQQVADAEPIPKTLAEYNAVRDEIMRR